MGLKMCVLHYDDIRASDTPITSVLDTAMLYI